MCKCSQHELNLVLNVVVIERMSLLERHIHCVIRHKAPVQFSRSVVSSSLRPHGLHYARLPCLSPTPGAHSNSNPLSQGCYPTISFSAVPFSSCLHSFGASGSFPVSQFFASGSQNIGVSAPPSVLSMNIQDLFPLG